MKVLTIALYDLIKFSRERTALLIMILVPIIFTFVMGTALGNTGSADSNKIVRIPVGIANLDQGPMAQEIIQVLKEDNTISIEELSVSELSTKVKNSNLELGFIIPENFSSLIQAGSQPEVKTLKLPNSADSMVIQNIFSTAFAKLHVKIGTEEYFKELLANSNIRNTQLIIPDIESKVSENLNKPDLVSVEMVKNGKQIVSKGLDNKTQISIGVLVMFVMFSVIFGAGDLLEEKKIHTWGRLSTTPTSNLQLILGKILGAFCKGWIQIGVLIAFGMLIGVKWGNSLSLTILILSVFLLAVTCLGFLLSTMVKTNSQLGAYASILIVCSSMMAGCYWPVEIEPVLMQKIAAIFPQYWAIKALKSTVGSTVGIQSTMMPILILVLMAIVFLILSRVVQFIQAKQLHVLTMK